MLATLFIAATMMQPAVAACGADSAAVDRVRVVASGIIDADNARDIRRVMDLYATDAWLMPPNEPPIQGHAAIRPRYEALFAQFDPAIEGHLDEVCVAGRTAFVRGRNGGRLVTRSTAPTRELADVYLMVLALHDDGHWRISHLIWHAAR